MFYVNQSYISTVKNGDLAMYNHNFILGQLLIAANYPDNVETYVCNRNQLNCIHVFMTWHHVNFKA